jgi:hypothetical protein
MLILEGFSVARRPLPPQRIRQPFIGARESQIAITQLRIIEYRRCSFPISSGFFETVERIVRHVRWNELGSNSVHGDFSTLTRKHSGISVKKVGRIIMSAPSSWVPSDFSDVVGRYQDNCRLVRTFSIELSQTLEWLTWLLGLSSLDSGPAIGSRPMTAIGAIEPSRCGRANAYSWPLSGRSRRANSSGADAPEADLRVLWNDRRGFPGWRDQSVVEYTPSPRRSATSVAVHSRGGTPACSR